MRSLLESLNWAKALAIVVAVFLVLDGFLLYPYLPPRQEPPSPSVGESTIAEETTSPLAVEHGEEGTVSDEAQGVRVLVGVMEVPIGLTVLEDGQLVHDQVTNPGFSEEFEAEGAITVEAADGGVVQVGVNDEPSQPLSASGEPASRTFTTEGEVT